MKTYVIFTGTLSHSVLKGIAELRKAFPDSRWVILHHRPSRSVARLVRNQIRNLKRNGWRWIPYQTRDLLQRLPTSGAADASRFPYPGAQYELSELLAQGNVEYRSVSDINGEQTAAIVKELDPELGLSIAAPILKPQVFEIPRLGTINLHKGKLPDFRGMPPAFWEFYTGAKEFGCTIHKVDRGLDSGPILLQSTVPKAPHSTVRGVQIVLDELGVRMMVDAIARLHEGATYQAQPLGGTTYRKPTLGQVAEMSRRERSEAGPRTGREWAKDLVFGGYVGLARPLPRRLRAMRNRQKVVVLLYHRVNDELRDAVTVGIERFEAQMAWVKRHYPVVSIEDILSGDLDRRAKRPLVAVTFDDGYLDNYENGVPILLRQRIPATFFVSTGKIGNMTGFAHDLEKLGRPLPMMTWDNLREMSDLGFLVGSHTVSHLDCGAAPLEVVATELKESRQALRKELSIEGDLFAYPFGGRRNMTSEALATVKELGFRCCFSAYGGCNGGDLDAFAIKRIGISHNFSTFAFRARLEGFA